MTGILDDLNVVVDAPVVPVQNLTLKRTKKKKNKYERRRQKARKAREQKTLEEEGSDECNNQQIRVDKNCTFNKSEQVNQSNTVNDPHPILVNVDNKDEDKDRDREAPNHSLPHGSKAQDAINNSLAARASYQNTDKPSTYNENLVTNSRSSTEFSAYEFHARPMELDQRSGARRSATIVSRESSHIFDNDFQNNTWSSLNIHPRLVKTLKSPKFNLIKPTIIQSKTIRAFQASDATLINESEHASRNKKNILINSETGSGKTLAYLLPILQSLAFGNKINSNIKNDQPKKITRAEMGCRCIIICPTRELANQTLQVLECLCQANFAGWIVPGGILGGDSRNSEKSRLRKGLAMIVATPGRLLDHLHKTESLALSLKGKLKWLVLDEADRLLDMGLGDQIRSIVQWIWSNEANSNNQQPWWRSVLVSATITSSVKSLAEEKILCGSQEWIWVKNEERRRKRAPEGINKEAEAEEIGTMRDSEEFTHSTPRQLAQFHVTVTAKLRLSTLVAFLVQRVLRGERTVVFMGTCASVDFHYQLFNSLEESLWDDGIIKDQGNSTSSSDANLGLFGRKARVFKLHGSVPHAKRIQTMNEFTKDTLLSDPRKSKPNADILLTTDVSSRGLNLKGFDWAIQYDPPCEIADYVHRVGRVARAGSAGHSLLFMLPSERQYLEVLKRKGITKLSPMSLSSILNQASDICKIWTQEGSIQRGDGRVGTVISSDQPGRIRSSRTGEHFAYEVQRRLEECITKDDTETQSKFQESASKPKQMKRKFKNNTKDGMKEGLLLTMARDAFLSFLRAYSTKKEPVVRSIFSSKVLHFGHIARSFALKEPPKTSAYKQKAKRQYHSKEVEDKKSNLPQSFEFSEQQVNQKYEDKSINTHLYDNDEPNIQNKKRKKSNRNPKSLLLENAVKMQNNLMDAM